MEDDFLINIQLSIIDKLYLRNVETVCWCFTLFLCEERFMLLDP